MQVRRLVLDHEGEQLGEIHYNPPNGVAKYFSSLVQAIMATIADNLQAVRARIGRAARAAGRDPAAVTLLAVSKTHPALRVREAAAAGQRAFGENYVQEALEKMRALPELEWHLIGPLQSNKTRPAAEHFAWVQTLQSEKIARRLSEQRPASLPPLNVLIQVNASGEATKSGVAPQEVTFLAKSVGALPRLRLRGLMAIPEPGAPAHRYREMASLYESLKRELAFDTLSMGMSDDLELAIAEGATMVRVGTAIFGLRKRQEAAA
jgi:pyridoxal phosphate enzyme (YggS family)